MAGFKDLASAVEREQIPKGWSSVWDLSEKWNISYAGAAMRANAHWRRKQCERRRIPNPSGIGGPICIYR